MKKAIRNQRETKYAWVFRGILELALPELEPWQRLVLPLPWNYRVDVLAAGSSWAKE